jgi:small ligand-binding sensory domain FIST
MRFAAALSTSTNSQDAIARVAREAADVLGSRPDLAVVFFSQAHAAEAERLAAQLCDTLSPGCLLGCAGEAIVGGQREIEAEPAVALWLASMPGVSIEPFHLQFERTPEGGTVVGWPDALTGNWPDGAALILLGEPYSFPADWLLERLNEDRPGVPVLGGMASGGHAPGENRIIFNRQAPRQGAVGVMIHGPVRIRAVVSQGCRPIGRHYVITRAEQNIIQELGGRPPLAALEELFASLPPADQLLARQGLHVGRVINEYQDHFDRGDFLVRNCLGADRDTGALAIGDYVRAGQTVQFHVRDAATADEDLRALLAQAKHDGDAQAALLFTCNGRGRRLFDRPDHDAGLLAELLGAVPVAGFFAQGEMGPIGGKNFLHGFTASAALFSS